MNMVISPAHQAQVICLRPAHEARVRLICFTHAGGTEAAFASWPTRLGGTIEVAAVRRPPLADYASLIERLTEAVSDYVSRAPRLPYALFGQSLGSLLVFGVARRLRHLHVKQPCCLLFASASSPQVPIPRWPYPPPQEWTIRDLVRFLHETGGTSEAVLNNTHALQRLLPRLQRDLAVRASFRYTHEPPFDYPLAVFGGRQDASLSMDGLAAWEAQTSAHCSLYRFPGGHFFMHDQETRHSFLQALCWEATRWLQDASMCGHGGRQERNEQNGTHEKY